MPALLALTVAMDDKEDVRRNAAWWAANYSSERAACWLDAIQSQLESIVDFPESHARSAENDEFPYEIRDKLLRLGSHPSYRAVFRIKDDRIFVLTVRHSSEEVLRPSEVESPPPAQPRASGDQSELILARRRETLSVIRSCPLGMTRNRTPCYSVDDTLRQSACRDVASWQQEYIAKTYPFAPPKMIKLARTRYNLRPLARAQKGK